MWLLQKIQQWYYYHGKPAETVDRGLSVPPIKLSGKCLRKLVPLTHYQAYSQLHCQKDSNLCEELVMLWRLYCAGDLETVKKYQIYFPTLHIPNPLYISFQQVVIKNMIVPTLTGEELSALKEYIDTKFQEVMNLHNNPWQACKTDTDLLDIDLKRQYITK